VGARTSLSTPEVQQPGHPPAVLSNRPTRARLPCLTASRAAPLVRMQMAWPRWPHFGRTRTLNAAIYCAIVSSSPAGQCGNGQVVGARDTVYGSDADHRRPHARMKTARQGGHPVVTGTMLEAATPPRAAGT
jgi:hypothetical protein